MSGNGLGNSQNWHGGERAYIGAGEVYLELLNREDDPYEDIPELDNARSARSELRVFKEILSDEIRDLSA